MHFSVAFSKAAAQLVRLAIISIHRPIQKWTSLHRYPIPVAPRRLRGATARKRAELSELEVRSKGVRTREASSEVLSQRILQRTVGRVDRFRIPVRPSTRPSRPPIGHVGELETIRKRNGARVV